jgi:hypothetical protein
LKRDWVRIFSTNSRVGMRSFSPPKGARSTLTKPRLSRTLRHTAFIMRRLMV